MRNIVRFNCQFSFLKLMYYKLLKSKSQSLRTENFQKTGFFLDLYLYLIINIIVLVDLINVKCFMNLNWSKWWLYSHFKCAPSLWRRYTAVRAFCMYSVKVLAEDPLTVYQLSQGAGGRGRGRGRTIDRSIVLTGDYRPVYSPLGGCRHFYD